MSVENGVYLLEQLKLENASETKEDTSVNWLEHYEERLGLLETELEGIFGDERWDKERRRLVSECVVVLSSHCGRHSRTSDVTRKRAKGLLSKVALYCGCSTLGGLLVGRGCEHQGTKSSPYQVRDVTPDKPAQDSSVVDRELPESNNLSENDDISENVNPLENVGLLEHNGLAEISEQMRSGCNLEGSDSHVTVTCSPNPISTTGVIKEILPKFKDNLTRDLWKSRPTYKHSLIWCLRNMTHPHVGIHLQSFLPPLLMFVDDYEVHNKIDGLRCLTHLIKSVNPTELRWHGQAMVIYDAISNLVYNNDISIINSLHPCVLRLLPILEGPPPFSLKEPKHRSFSDDIFGKYLSSIEIESKIPECQALTNHLCGYIELLGVGVVRHLQRLLNILYQCVKYPDCNGEYTRVNSLRALRAVIKVAWIRIPPHKDDILKCLLKLIVDCCHGDRGELPDTDKPDYRILNDVIECLVALEQACGTLQPHMEKLESECKHVGLKHCIHKWKERLQYCGN